MPNQSVIVLDFGGQYNQLIARRVRECNVYCEVKPNTMTVDEIRAFDPIGIIFTGGPQSVYAEGSPQVDPEIFRLGIPILGICYGCQLMAQYLGGEVTAAGKDTAREYGKTQTWFDTDCRLFRGLPEQSITWMSHGDYMAKVPESFRLVAHSDACPTVGICDEARGFYGVQFHPEVNHTRYGKQMIKNFLFEICGAKGDWTMGDFCKTTVERLRAEIGDGRVLLALSGGVDSSVAAYLMKEKGYECIGITIKTFNETGDGIKRENTCCSLDDVSDARSVACTLGIRHFLYNFTGQNAEDYPRTQSMNSTSNSIMLPTNVLIDNISRSLFATASDELRPVMNGIYFDLTADALAIVASDGHKLVRNRNYTIKSETPASFILPKKPASLLKAILTRDSEDVEIKFDERSAEILFTDGEMKCRLIDGRYPNYNSVIPNNPNEVTVDRKALISALRRVMPFASESSQLVRFSIEPGRMEVSSEDMDFSTSARPLTAGTHPFT